MSKFCADEYTKNPGKVDFKFHPAPPQQAAGIVPPQFASACKACGLPQMRTPLQSVKGQVSCQSAEAMKKLELQDVKGQVGCQSTEARKKLPDQPSLQKGDAIVSSCKCQIENLSSEATGFHIKEIAQSIPQQLSPQNELHPKSNKTLSKFLDLRTMMEDRLKESKLKRSLEKYMQARHNSKRPKREPENIE
jgi:hypothetical protein